MKICGRCKVEKDESEFNKKGKGLQPNCKDCNRAYGKEHYQKNKEYYAIKGKKFRIETYEWYRNILSQCECFECGENHPATFDWHHEFPEDKIDCISHMINGKARATIIVEMNKCIILCANCHRKLHYDKKV